MHENWPTSEDTVNTNEPFGYYGDEDYFGDLHDYQSGEYLRPASLAELSASRASGPEGVFLCEAEGRTCFVVGE